MKLFDVLDFHYQPDTAQLFERIKRLPGAIWLDSGKPGSLYGRFDIISAAPDTIIETSRDQTCIRSEHTTHHVTDDPFDIAEELLAPYTQPSEKQQQLLFDGGLIGFWGYQLGNRIHQLPNPSSAAFEFPDMHLGRYQWALIINHATHQAQLVFHQSCSHTLKREVQTLLAENTPSDQSFQLTAPFSNTESQQDYLQALAEIQRYILAGDCYQVNYAQHFSAPYKGDTWQAYRILREALPSPFSGYLDLGANRSLLSLSPERFIKVSSGNIETKPIKGTTRRGKNIVEDHANAVALQNSDKDRAENLMIVDLLRNDLSKSCQPGSIHVPQLFTLESYANVHHLVSTITGRLKESATALSALRNCFPGGSITGTPKKRAMEIIQQLEAQQRAGYCGSLGYVGFNGRMDTNITIRTLITTQQHIHCWGGGGIVADSSPHQEYRESLDKVRLLMTTLETTLV